MAKVVAFKIVFQGLERIISNTEEWRKAMKEVNAALEKATRGTPEFERLVRTKAALYNASNRLRQAVFQQRKELTAAGREAGVAEGSYEQLSAQLSALTFRFKALSRAQRDGIEGQRLEREIRGVSDELKQLDARMGRYQRNVGNYGGALGSLRLRFTDFVKGGFIIAGIDRIADAMSRLGRSIFDSNVSVSDQLGDIQRVTQASRAEVEQIFEDIKALDTRVNLDELLNFGIIGGKLGVPTKDIAGFVDGLNKLEIALGGELGDDAEKVAEQLGKIVNIFGDRGAPIGPQIEGIGNAFVTVANAGVATGPFLADFVERLAGIAEITGLTLGEAIGLGAGFEELGQTAEVSSTAINQAFLQIGEDVEGIANLVGIPFQELQRLLAEDPTEALIRVSQAIAGSSDEFAGLQERLNRLDPAELQKFLQVAESQGIEQAAKTLGLTSNQIETISKAFKQFGLDGRRAVATLAVLGGNAEFFREKIDLATNALLENGAITDAVAIKQNTLAGALERAGNAILELFTGSALNDFFVSFFVGVERAANSVRDFLDPVSGLSRAVKASRADFSNLVRELPPLIEKYRDLRQFAVLNKEQQEELGRVIQEIAKIAPIAVSEFDKYGNALDISAKKADAFLLAQQKVNEELEKQTLAQFRNQIEGFTFVRDSFRGRVDEELASGDRNRFSNLFNLFDNASERAVSFNQNAIQAQESIDELVQKFAKLNNVSITEAASALDVEISPGLQKLVNEFNDFVGPVLPDFRRTVASIKKEIAELEKSLEGSSDPGEISAIQVKIRKLQKELQSLLGSGGGGLNPKEKAEPFEFLAGSVGRFREQISRLEKELEAATSIDRYVAKQRELLAVTDELNALLREQGRALLEAEGFSFEPDRLEDEITRASRELAAFINENRTLLEIDGIVDEEGVRQGLLQSITQAAVDALPLRLKVEEEYRDKILEIAKENEQEAYEQWREIRRKQEEEHEESERRKAEITSELIENTLAGIGEIFADAISGEIENAEDALKAFLLLSVNIIEQYLIAITTARQSQALLAGDFTAVARAAIAIGSIRAVFAGLRAAINSIDTPGFEEGKFDHAEGYTGHGSTKEIAGVVHRDEIVVPSRTVHHPDAQPHIARLAEISRAMGYRSGGRAGFQDGRFPLSGPSAVSQAVVVNNIVSLSDGDIQKIAKSVKEGTEAGAATGLQKASKDSQRRAKLERKTGF